MSEIGWVDGEGVGVLNNGKLHPGSRFANWVPNRVPIGRSVVGLGTGITYTYEFRRDDLIAFELRHIPEALLEDAVRLEYHLLHGGLVTVSSDRGMAASFASCIIAPGTQPQLQPSNPRLREYTFSVQLKASEVGSGGGGAGSSLSHPALLLIHIDGEGEPIEPGIKLDIPFPKYSAVITGWTLVADVTGDMVIDLWTDAYGNYPPTVADSITAAEKPALSSAIKNTAASVGTWDAIINQGDTLRVNVDSADTITRATLGLSLVRV